MEDITDTSGTYDNANDAPTFAAGDGKVTTDFGDSFASGIRILALPDGKYFLYGRAGTALAIAKYNADGSLDTSFDGDGKALAASGLASSIGDIATQADGKLLLLGSNFDSLNRQSFSVSRLNTDGTFDTSFSGDGITTSHISGGAGAELASGIAVQADGKIVIVGSASGASSNDFAVTRYTANGELDTLFNGTGSVLTNSRELDRNDVAVSVVMQPDGKILVAGLTGPGPSYSYNEFGLVRYNSDGSLDTTFGGSGAGSPSSAGIVITSHSLGSIMHPDCIALQPDGKILVAAGGSNSNSIVLYRYNSNGSLDTSFDSDGRVLTQVGSGQTYAQDLIVQADGKILVIGRAQNGTSSDIVLVRYNSDGSLDSTFDGDGKVTTAIGTGDAHGRDAVILPNGDILVAGHANASRSSADFAVVRYNADGSLDTTFDAQNTLNATPTFTEGGAAVVLDSAVAIRDDELSLTGNYDGASVTLARQGGASAEDVFGASDALSFSGGNAILSGVTIGTFIQSAGTLTITFNANATQARVDAALSAITYANTSNAPPASVTIGWTFSDGNTGAQGPGGALTATGTTTVTIAAVNAAPVGTVTISDTTPTETLSLTATRAITDADGTANATFATQWQQSDALGGGTVFSDIAGATDATFTPGQDQVNRQLRAVVTYTDDQGFAESVTSAATTVTGDYVLDNAATITGNAGADLLNGEAGGNNLVGGLGDDTLNGGAGNDTLNGGSGNDTASYAGVTADLFVSLANAVVFSPQNTLGAGIDLLQGIENIIGGSGNDTLTGSSVANILSGGDGDDTFVYTVPAGPDTIDGGNGTDTLLINGAAGTVNDTVSVTFNGTSITSFQAGSMSSVETITINLGAGTDTIVVTTASAGTAIDLNGGMSSGNLILVGVENATGGNGNDTLTGGMGVNVLSGGAGNDTLIATVDDVRDIFSGNAGPPDHDTLDYSAYSANLTVTLVATNTGLVTGSGSSIANTDQFSNIENFIGGSGNDRITGFSAGPNVGANRLGGGAGNDTLDGGGGIDTLAGGSGDDIFIADIGDSIDVIEEAADEGTDTVRTYSKTYTLGNNIEILQAASSIGSTLTFSGNALANTIITSSGADILDGKAGADTMTGGIGNDTYFVDDVGDVVTELAGQGTADTVRTSLAAYTLANHVEVLTTFVGSTIDQSLTGNDLANTITGGGGNDTLNGGVGNDTLGGGIGSDTAVFTGSLFDATIAVTGAASVNLSVTTAGGGSDTLNHVGFGNFEHIEFSEGSFALVQGTILADGAMVGTTEADLLLGLAGNDWISGGDGADVLVGGAGADTMYGGSGNDIFDFNALTDSLTHPTTRDVIMDFASGDVIDLRTLDADTSTGANDTFVLTSGGGSGAFTAAGQVRFTLIDTDAIGGVDSTLIELNVNATLAADFQLLLKDHTATLDTGSLLL